jgi:hypothetical protein
MNKTRAMVIGLYILGAILLLAPVPAMAGPQLPGEALGTHVYCGKTVTIGSKLGSTQPLRVHGICQEILSIADTRVNITIIGDGANVVPVSGDSTNNGGSACAANYGITTIIPDDPSAAEIVQVRGKNILLTALNIFGLRADDPSIVYPVGPLGLPDWDPAQCPGSTPTVKRTITGDSENAGCSNNRGVRAQRNGILQLGRQTRLGALPLAASNEDPRFYEEKTGICIKYVGSNGIEATQGSFLRVINSEVQHVGGDAVLIAEGSAATIGFASGSEYKLATDAFAGPGHSGPNYLHNNTGAGVTVDRGSEARIVNNFVAFNGKAGIAVTRASQADVDSNRIDGNLGSGVTVADNSNISLGTTFVPGCDETTWGAPCGTPGTFDPRTLANTVTVANTSFGIKCTIGGSISGRSSTDRAGLLKGLVGNGGVPVSRIGGGSGVGYSTFGDGTSPTGDLCIDKTT